MNTQSYNSENGENADENKYNKSGRGTVRSTDGPSPLVVCSQKDSKDPSYNKQHNSTNNTIKSLTKEKLTNIN